MVLISTERALERDQIELELARSFRMAVRRARSGARRRGGGGRAAASENARCGGVVQAAAFSNIVYVRLEMRS